jgi:transposase, IS6 family
MSEKLRRRGSVSPPRTSVWNRHLPRVINLDKNPAYPPAVEQLEEECPLPNYTQLRQCKSLNNLVEQDHRFIKRRVNAGLGFFSFKTAGRTIREYESMNMIREGE